jgi:hypothetical protein
MQFQLAQSEDSWHFIPVLPDAGFILQAGSAIGD